MFKLYENDILIGQSSNQHIVLDKLRGIVQEAIFDGADIQRKGDEEKGSYLIDGRLYSVKVD